MVSKLIFKRFLFVCGFLSFRVIHGDTCYFLLFILSLRMKSESNKCPVLVLPLNRFSSLTKISQFCLDAHDGWRHLFF